VCSWLLGCAGVDPHVADASTISPVDVPKAAHASSTAERYRFPTEGSGIDTGGALIVVHAPMERVLEAVLDFGDYHEVLPRLEESRIVQKRAGSADVYLRAPILGGLVSVWGIVRFADPAPWAGDGLQVAGELVKGNLDAWSGVWKLEPMGPHTTALRLEMFIDVQVPVPDEWVTPELMWAADTAVTAIRDRVEAPDDGGFAMAAGPR
jgi:hypothetical protein